MNTVTKPKIINIGFLITIVSFCFIFLSAHAQRISVVGTKFVVNGNEIILNGANTPWNHWNDFGGKYESDWWNAEFNRIKNAGGNCTRIWITCSGDGGVTTESDGTVTGATDKFWEDVTDMFQLAQKNKIYIKATLISFDHFKNNTEHYQNWRKMVMSDKGISSYIDNYVIPFVVKFKDNPYLWSIDACNEIEWVNQNEECGKIPWDRLQCLVARTAAAVHENSEILVTMGGGAVKWNSNKFEGNFWSDSALQKQYNHPEAKLDFYSLHYYGWTVKYCGNYALDKTPEDYGIGDRPCMIGENPAKGVFNDAANPKLVVSPADMFIKSYQNGWKGIMPWTSNGVDRNGTLDDFKDGLKMFRETYPNLIEAF